MEKSGSQQSVQGKEPTFVFKFCLAQVVSHHHCEGGMGGHGCKHPHKGDANSAVAHVKNIFKRGKTHAHHDGIDNAVEGFIEIWIVVEDATYKNELAKFFHEGHQQKCMNGLL